MDDVQATRCRLCALFSGIAEMLAMEMKSSGLYVSRGLSYRQTQFQTVEVALTEDQVKMYNMAAHVWYASCQY